MAMLAEYHATIMPSNSDIRLQLKKCKTGFFRVEDKFRNLQTILKDIEIMIETEDRNTCLSDMKTEIENIIQSTNIHVLQDYLHSVDEHLYKFNYLSVKRKHSILSFYLIAYHVLVTSEKENDNEILNVIRVKLQEKQKFTSFLHLDSIFQLYIDMYYKDNSNETFTNIHAIWKSDPTTELNLKLAYCIKLIEAKDYKTLIKLIHHNADYFIQSFEVTEHQLCTIATMVLLHIVNHQVSINKMEKVKTIETIMSTITSKYSYCNEHNLLNNFHDFILTLNNKQILSTPLLIKLLHLLMKKHPFDCLKIILLCSNRLRQANHFTECIEFIKCHFQFILSFPIDKLKIENECYCRQQYCIALLLLLDEYVSSNDAHKINLVITKLQDLRISFLSDRPSSSCFCFMGTQECSFTTCKREKSIIKSRYRPEKHMEELKQDLLDCYKRISWITFPRRSTTLFSHYSFTFQTFDSNMVNITSMNTLKDESIIFFTELIKRSADNNAASLYNIIKTVCAFDLKLEVQDMVVQGLIAYLIISCNGHYWMLSKFILDINMICQKGSFLQKLTSDIATLWLKLEEDTVNDFRKTIYKCYCTVRHDSKNEKDTNIEQYKTHFAFIASMEAEEKMKKLTSQSNLLLMLTLLLIASGGHHKSAELKKYLSLKYEYEDSILYLLWCSGDVEVNPGPTLRKLRKVPKSQKERSWMYEMCSILLRLLKFESIDLKNDGLWREKPVLWPNEWPFYDPHNKPKDEKYGIENDRKLLKNIEQLCNEKGIFEDINKFDDDTKSKVKEYKTEITAWTNNKTKLFEVYTLRQELNRLKEAKGNLHKYRNDPEVLQFFENLNAYLTFDPKEDKYFSSESYTDIVRDLVMTFCRIDKGLDPLEKSDGIWKKPPTGWCPTDDYFSPCNAGKRQGKCKDKKLVDKLLKCCETMVHEYCNANKKPVLLKILHAWKHENVQEVRKYHTIWSNIEVIDHSLKYLKLEGLLAKSQTNLEKLGIKPKDFKESTQESTDLSSPPFQDKQNNPKCPTTTRSHQENHFDPLGKLRDSDASQKVVPLSLMGREYQETDQTTQNNTNKRKHQSTDENYTEPKKLHKSDKGKSLPIHTSSTEQCQGEPINDQTPITVLDDILDLQDESNLNKNSSSFTIPIQDSSSTTNQSSDLSNELPEYVQLYIDTVQNSYNPDDTLHIDVDQFIEELDMDSS
ncbi:Hypothetical predicted protein [Mytilus galloprovincialis]|uniref:Uncharacterized protein n=1 Tax=Mytilus galloprovincialis TaxID=29158 RepID=A0A8B6GC15_MYTGA|nr:Hypothetical predicted protein [Mytilus galloprovincialis]